MYNDDDDMVELNWNNIQAVKRDAFRMLFDGLRRNTNLKALSLANTRLTDSATEHLLEALRCNKHLRVLNIESNYISGNMLRVTQAELIYREQVVNLQNKRKNYLELTV